MGQREGWRHVRDAKRVGQRDSGALRFDLAIEGESSVLPICASISAAGVPKRFTGVDVGRQRGRRVERLCEQRVECRARGRRRARRGRCLVFGRRERELRLHHLQARRAARVEARLCGIRAPHREIALFPQQHQARFREQLAE